MKRCRFNYKNYYKDNLSWKEKEFAKMKHKKFWCRVEQVRMFFRWNLSYAKWYVRIHKHNQSWIKNKKSRPIHPVEKIESKLKRRKEMRRRFSYVTNNLLIRPLFLILIPIAYGIILIAVAILSVFIPVFLLFANLKINDGMTISWNKNKNTVE